jgi:hypothetical protein
MSTRSMHLRITGADWPMQLAYAKALSLQLQDMNVSCLDCCPGQALILCPAFSALVSGFHVMRLV